jgi:hypothetical protein
MTAAQNQLSSSLVSSAPSWIAGISDSVIRADMAAADVNGVVSEAGMAKLFTDLAAELSATRTTLSTSQFNDLHLIAANLNVGEVASEYLTYVVNALILGNAANAKWTGGGATSVALGNLAVGSTATQLNELTGKWLLGTDLPSNTVSMGGSSFTVSYSADPSPLYGASGPSANDINQGRIGDCYLLACLAEVASQHSSAITSMITDNGNGSYGVRFYVGGQAKYVTVSNQLANGGNAFNTGPALWGSLIEQGYAQLQATGSTTGNSYSGNSFTAIGNGGVTAYALAEITGASEITQIAANGSSWLKYTYNNSMAYQSGSSGLTTDTILATIKASLEAHNDVVLSSRTNAYDSSGHITLVASHAMSIYGVDYNTNMLEIRNPWGSQPGQYWNTTFQVSLSTLLAAGDTITIDNAGGGASGPNTVNVLVSAAAGLQANASVSSFTILDMSSNVMSSLSALAADTKLTAISFLDTSAPVLTMTEANYLTLNGVVAKFGGAYTLAITGATVAQAAALQADSHDTTFTVVDSAANVSAAISSLTADSKLTAITLTDTVKPTISLSALDYLGGGAILAKIGSPYNLAVTGANLTQAAALQTDGRVRSFSVAISSTDMSKNLTTLMAETKISAISLSDATKPTFSMSETAFLSSSSLFGKIVSNYSLILTDATAAQASGAQENSHVTSFTVSDKAANIFANMTSLLADNKISAVNFTDVPSPTISLTESAYLADASILAKARGVYSLLITGANSAQAADLQANSHVVRFTVTDSAANVSLRLSALQSDTKLTSITLSDATTPMMILTSAAYQADTAVLAKIVSPYNLFVTGSAVSKAAALQADSHVALFSLTDTAANITANLTSLIPDTKLGAISLTDLTKPTINLTGTAYQADRLVLAKITSAYNLGVSAATIGQAAELQANDHVANFSIADSAVNVASSLAALLLDSKLSSIVLTNAGTPTLSLTGAAYAADTAVLAKISGAYKLAISGVTASQASAAQSDSHTASFTISDSAANVATNLTALLADSKLTAINLTDSATQTISLSGSAYAADVAVLAKISSPYNLIVTGTKVAQAAGLQADTHVARFTILDSAANVAPNYAALLADTKLSSIAFTDAATPLASLTGSSYAAYASVLAKITSPYNLVVTGATVAQAAGIQANSHDTSFTISDSSANVMAGISGLIADTKISAIKFTDSGKPNLTQTEEAHLADASVLAKVSSAYTLAVTGANVAQAAALQLDTLVTSFTVNTAAADLINSLASLLADSKLSSITLSDSVKPSFNVTETTWLADSRVFGKISSAYDLTVTGATVAQAVALQADSHVTGFTVTDTAANITASLAVLNADNKLLGMTISEGGGATLNLLGSHAAATINIGTAASSAKAGMSAASLTFNGTVGVITLGDGAAVITDTLIASNGVVTVNGFTFGIDELILHLNGAANSTVMAADTLLNGVHAVSIYDTLAPNSGVVLAGLDASVSAADIMEHHLTFSRGDAIFV